MKVLLLASPSGIVALASHYNASEYQSQARIKVGIYVMSEDGGLVFRDENVLDEIISAERK